MLIKFLPDVTPSAKLEQEQALIPKNTRQYSDALHKISGVLVRLQMMANETSTPENQSYIYRQLDDYPWDQDKEFQGGLSAILGPNPVSSQIYELTLRARCFYFSRKTSIPVSYDGYKAYVIALESQQTSLKIQAESSHASIPKQIAPYPPSFAEIIDLLSNNAPIPGIRDIPPTVIPEQASVATAPKRKKPWDNNILEKNIDTDSLRSFEENTNLQNSIETEK